MRRFILSLVALVGVGVGVALATNYTMTQGAGTTFGSIVVGGVNYAQQFICDLTTPGQCAAVSPSGAVKVDNSAVTQPISATSLPLPTSAATSANQTTANTSLATIATNTGAAIPPQSPAVPIGGMGICDGANGTTNPCTTAVTVKAASTPAAATDKAIVVDQRPGTNLSAANVTATPCSGTISTGGTAQNAFTAQTTLHGFSIVNIDTTEPLWISFTTTAAANGTDSYPLPAATPTTFAGLGSFTSPPGFGLNHALSVIAATTSHKYSCSWW
jgi:hypothetical protein